MAEQNRTGLLGAAGGWGGNEDGDASGRVGDGGGEGSTIGMYAGTIVLGASDDDQSLHRTFRTTDDGWTPASARGLYGGENAIAY